MSSNDFLDRAKRANILLMADAEEPHTAESLSWEAVFTQVVEHVWQWARDLS